MSSWYVDAFFISVGVKVGQFQFCSQCSQRVVDVCIHRSHRDAHLLGNVFVLHVVQIAKRKSLLAFVRQLLELSDCVYTVR